MGVSARQAIDHYRQRAREATDAARQYGELVELVRDAGTRANQALVAASIELAGAYLPGLTPAFLERVEQLTGFVGFKRRDPTQAMDHERQTLERSVTRLEAEPDYQRREELAGPDGTLRAKIAEAEEMQEPFSTECEKFESLPLFTELVNVGYDTPDFAEPWWSAKYWKFWKAGDSICEALEMDDFGDDVLPAYQTVAKQRTFWQRELAQLKSQLEAVHELVRQHDQAKARIPELANLYLKQSQEVLAEHLRGADMQLLEEWRDNTVPDDRGIQMALRKVAGLRAKFEILQSLHDNALSATRDDLVERANKYHRKSAKYGRSKYRYGSVPDSELDHKFGTKLPKLQDRHQKFTALVSRIDRYDDFDHFDLHNDPELWWHEMSGGKRPPSQLGHYRRYYDRHPNLTPKRDQTAAPRAVERAAAVIPREDDLDEVYLS